MVIRGFSGGGRRLSNLGRRWGADGLDAPSAFWKAQARRRSQLRVCGAVMGEGEARRGYPSAREFGHRHGEAFMVMKYEGIVITPGLGAHHVGGPVEWLWNSRDGVTPFYIQARDQVAEMAHADWHMDRYEPNYVPPVGSRIFVDMTRKRARALAVRRVEKFWDHPRLPLRSVFTSKPAAVEQFTEEAWQGGYSPDIIEVDSELHEYFKARAEGREVEVPEALKNERLPEPPSREGLR